MKNKKRAKIKSLRVQYNFAKSAEEKRAVLEKAFRVNPNLTEKTFLELMRAPKAGKRG